MERNPLTLAPDNPFGRIIGVAGNVKDGSLRGAAEPTVFYTNSRLVSPGMTLIVRTSRGAELTREAARVIRELDPNLPVTQIRLLDEAFIESVSRERLNAIVSAALELSDAGNVENMIRTTVAVGVALKFPNSTKRSPTCAERPGFSRISRACRTTSSGCAACALWPLTGTGGIGNESFLEAPPVAGDPQ